MKILLIGGTGTISMAITKLLAKQGHELYLLNRGNRNSDLPENVKIITADISEEAATAKKLEGMEFDCVGDREGARRDPEYGEVCARASGVPEGRSCV